MGLREFLESDSSGGPRHSRGRTNSEVILLYKDIADRMQRMQSQEELNKPPLGSLNVSFYASHSVLISLRG